MSDCTCPEVYLNTPGEAGLPRNWNPKCAEHGLKSEWWRSPEQVARREAQSIRLRELQEQARRARAAARADSVSHCHDYEPHPEHAWGGPDDGRYYCVGIPTQEEIDVWHGRHPNVQRFPCGSMSNAGYRCELMYGHRLPHFSREFGVERTWTHSDHI